MAPRRGGGGVHIDFGGGSDGSSVDPETLGSIFQYVTLGCFALYYLYIIVATLKHKINYPYIFLYHAVAYVFLSILFSVLAQLIGSIMVYPAGIFMTIGYSLMWLFTFEPSRHIMNLQNSDPSFERASIFRIKQYLGNGGVGITLLSNYIFFFIYVLISLISAIVGATMPYNATIAQYLAIKNLNIFIAVAPWFFFVSWCYFTYKHHSIIPHAKSYYYYGFFLLLSLIISCVFIGIPDMDLMAAYIVNFVLYDCTLIFAVYTALRFAHNWVSLTKYDFASK